MEIGEWQFFSRHPVHDILGLKSRRRVGGNKERIIATWAESIFLPYY